MDTNPSAPALADDAACNAAIERLGSLDLTLATIETTKSLAVAAATKVAEEAATPLLAERKEIEASVAAYAVENRERITAGFRTKTATMPAGEIAFRMGRPRVVVDTALLPKIIEKLRERGLKRMIRTREELDRTAIAREPDEVKRIAGLSIEPAVEEVVIKPIASPLADRP